MYASAVDTSDMDGARVPLWQTDFFAAAPIISVLLMVYVGETAVL